MLIAASTAAAADGGWPAILTLALSAVAFLVALKAYRHDRANTAIEIRRQWESLHDDWATTILLARGPDDYYTDAQIDERQRLRETMSQYSSLDVTAQVNIMRAYTRTVRRVARFFAYASSMVLQGRLSLRDAYGIFGPEMGRHRPVVSWLSGGERSDPVLGFIGPYGEPDWDQMLDQVPETTFFRERQEIELLFELIWARMAQRHDTYLHIIFQNALWLRATGRHRRTRSIIPVLRPSPITVIRNAAFRAQLRHATHLPLSAITESPDPEPLLPAGFAAVLRKPLASRRLLERRLARAKRLMPERFAGVFGSTDSDPPDPLAAIGAGREPWRSN